MGFLRKKAGWLALAVAVALGAGALPFFLLDSAQEPPTRLEAGMARLAKRLVIPLRAGSASNPVKSETKTLGEGRKLYLESCAICHGSDGRSQTALARSMYPPSPDLTSARVQQWSDAELYWIIQNGIRLTGMPAWKGTLSDAEIWKVILYLRALPQLNRAAASRTASFSSNLSRAELKVLGKSLMERENCLRCHSYAGRGAGLAPDLSLEWARGRSDEWILGHFKDPPAFTERTMMPSFAYLSEEELHALTAFLQDPVAE